MTIVTTKKDILEVPVVDIAALVALHDSEVDAALEQQEGDIRAIIDGVRAAATEWGFFYIANHGVTPENLELLDKNIRRFFGLPQDVLNTIRRHETNTRGYFDSELTKNKVDWKQVFDFAGKQEDGPPNDAIYRRMFKDDQNQWLPEETLPGFRKDMEAYFSRIEQISRRLLKVFAVALGEKANFFDQFYHNKDANGEITSDNNSSLLRVNYYPVAPNPEGTMGVYQHTDPGALTVLLQDDKVASLQVFHRETQEWYNVPPKKDTYVINIGDMVQVWSNDKFVAPLHRVLASGTHERFSVPFFYNPSYESKVEPIVVHTNEKPKYKSFTWYEFMHNRAVGNYADEGEEIQISRFRIPNAA